MKRNMVDRLGQDRIKPDEYSSEKIVLRDGRKSVLWVNQKTGHGILDSEFWEDQNYYKKEYRNEYSPIPGEKCQPSDRLKILDELSEKQFRSFSKYLRKSHKYLEVGCSNGGILKRVIKKGVKLCHAVEPNKEDVNYVRNKIKGVKIFNTTFDQAALPKNYYDVVVNIEVLEHTDSPWIFLEKCYSTIKKNGLLHIEVPNHSDALLTIYKDTDFNSFYYHKAHIHYFTKKSLSDMCSEVGFEGEVFSFLMYPFFNHVWWSQNRCPQNSAADALSKLLPADNKTRAGKAVNNFYNKVELEYEKLINSHCLGSCLIFQGRKR